MLSGKKARKPRLLATVSLPSTLSLSRWLRPPVCLRVSVFGVGGGGVWGAFEVGVAATREVDHSVAVVSHHEDGYTGPLTYQNSPQGLPPHAAFGLVIVHMSDLT